MEKSGGIIGIIGGVLGIGAALFTLLLGGVAGAFGDGGLVLGLGVGGVIFSLFAIIFGSVALSKPRGGGIGMIVTAVLGSILGGLFVAVFMLLPLIGGVMALVASRRLPPASPEILLHDEPVSRVSIMPEHEITPEHEVTPRG